MNCFSYWHSAIVGDNKFQVEIRTAFLINPLSPNQNKQKHHTYCLGQQVDREHRIHDRGLDVSYMEATGNQTVDLNFQFGTIVATNPHLQLNRNPIPSPPPSINFVVHPCPSHVFLVIMGLKSKTVNEIKKVRKSRKKKQNIKQSNRQTNRNGVVAVFGNNTIITLKPDHI